MQTKATTVSTAIKELLEREYLGEDRYDIESVHHRTRAAVQFIGSLRDGFEMHLSDGSRFVIEVRNVAPPEQD